MESKNPALDRVLEALSPALATELDRLAGETRQTLEQELENRLQKAVRDAETGAKVEATAQLALAVADAQERTRKQVTAELEQRFQGTLAETRDRLKAEAAAEQARLQEQVNQWRVFAESERRLAEASSQSEILARFLKMVEPFAAGLAIYVTKADGLALWKSRGNGAFPEIISQQTTDPESYFRTIVVRNKTVGAIAAAPPFKSEALEFLTTSLARAIESFGLKIKAPLPKPVIASETVAAVRRQAATAADASPVAAGWAEPDDQKARADARRIARLLVSEIKLYHEQELKKGREHSDIYDRLQKEIDLGRQKYKQRVSSSVLAAEDYFHEELVRILGENDLSRMGAAYPGAMKSQDV